FKDGDPGPREVGYPPAGSGLIRPTPCKSGPSNQATGTASAHVLPTRHLWLTADPADLGRLDVDHLLGFHTSSLHAGPGAAKLARGRDAAIARELHSKEIRARSSPSRATPAA